MRTTVHTVNHRGSDEFSIHILGDHQPKVVAIFTKSDKATNRRNAIEAARQMAFEMRCKHAMNHGISQQRFNDFLPKDAR